MELWKDFQQKAYAKVLEAAAGKSMPAIIWTNSMTEEGVENFLPVDDYIIQLWTKIDVWDQPNLAKVQYKNGIVLYCRTLMCLTSSVKATGQSIPPGTGSTWTVVILLGLGRETIGAHLTKVTDSFNPK